jgi:hypothetical protein
MSTQPIHALAVGKPYHPNRRGWAERGDYNYRDGGHELLLFVGQASRSEVEAVRSGPIEFGLLVDQPFLFLLTRFLDPAGEVVLAFDCSYSWHRVPAAHRTLPAAVSPELRALLTIVLVEATDGMVRVLRTVAFSPELTRAIHKAITEQATMPYDQAEHDRAVEATLRLTTDERWEKCAIRCRGGE